AAEAAGRSRLDDARATDRADPGLRHDLRSSGEVDRRGRLEDHVPAGARASAGSPVDAEVAGPMRPLPADRADPSARTEADPSGGADHDGAAAAPAAASLDHERAARGRERSRADRVAAAPTSRAGVDPRELAAALPDDGAARVDDRFDPEEVVPGIAIGEDVRARRSSSSRREPALR